MPKEMKTNVMRHLDALKIPYEARSYPVDESQLDGLHAAQALGLPPAMVFKTLVLVGDHQRPLVCCLPVDRELDLKAVARATGNKSVSMLPQKDLLGLTGYLRGGCSPIGMKKRFPTYVDASAQDQPRIAVSAGARGHQVILDTPQLLACTGGVLAELA